MQDSIVDADKIKRAVAEAGAHTQESSPHDFLEPRSMAVLEHDLSGKMYESNEEFTVLPAPESESTEARP